MRVATANSAGGRDNTGLMGAQAWARWVGVAAALEIDVLAVQEVDHFLPRSEQINQTSVLAAALAGQGSPWESRFAAAVYGTPGSRATFGPASTTRADEPSYGVALLSRHPVRRWAELRLGPSRLRIPVPLPPGAGRRVLWVPDEPRVALAAVVAAPGGDVCVVTTHLSFSPLRARAQLRQVVRWCRDLPRPLVLMGDLNLPARLATGATGWEPALGVPTYPCARPRVQLDHVLLDGHLMVRKASALSLADSDHLALTATLVAGPLDPTS